MIAALLALSLGADAGFLFRDEAGGNRTVLPTIAPRLAVDVAGDLRAVLSWGIAYDPAESEIAAASTLHNRWLGGVEYAALRVRAASLALGGGPAGTWMRTTLGSSLTRGIVRPGAWGGLSLDVALAEVTLRTGVQVVWTQPRTDIVVGLGAAFTLGGAP